MKIIKRYLIWFLLPFLLGNQAFGSEGQIEDQELKRVITLCAEKGIIPSSSKFDDFEIFLNSAWILEDNSSSINHFRKNLFTVGAFYGGVLLAHKFLPERTWLGLLDKVHFGLMGALGTKALFTSNGYKYYRGLCSEQREDLLTTYINAVEETTISNQLHDLGIAFNGLAEAIRRDETIPKALVPLQEHPTAAAFCTDNIISLELRRNIILSCLNASELTRRIEDDPQLNNQQKLLEFLNSDLRDFTWTNVECFNLITGDYDLYMAGQECIWRKQPALIVWSHSPDQPRIILVAFKGTNFKCWADRHSAFNIKKEQLSDIGKVHAGFYGISNSCQEVLEEKIQKVCHEMNVDSMSVQLLFTGHSMGGAVAALSGVMQLAKRKQFLENLETVNENNNVIVINFGQPRVWDRYRGYNQFKALLGERNLARFVTTDKEGRPDPITGYRDNDKDFWGFKHFGEEYPLRLPKNAKIHLFFGISTLHKLVDYRYGWKINYENIKPE